MYFLIVEVACMCQNNSLYSVTTLQNNSPNQIIPVFGPASAPVRAYAMWHLANSFGSRDVTAGPFFIASIIITNLHAE